MENFDIQITDEAITDLKTIYLYISNSLMEPKYALQKITNLKNKITTLSTFPLRNKLVQWEPWHSEGIRQMAMDNYIIYYETDEQNTIVNVLRIFYGKRDIEKIINKCS